MSDARKFELSCSKSNNTDNNFLEEKNGMIGNESRCISPSDAQYIQCRSQRSAMKQELINLMRGFLVLAHFPGTEAFTSLISSTVKPSNCTCRHTSRN